MTRRRSEKVEIVVQNCPLLNIPPELRNSIYEYVVTGTTAISCRDRKLSYSPALSKVSRQLRKEYEGIYRAEAPRYAAEFNFDITDFHIARCVNGDILPVIEEWQDAAHANYTLPGSVNYDPKAYRMHIRLTSGFDHHLLHSRILALSSGIETGHRDNNGEKVRLEFEYTMNVDSKTFDVDFAKRSLQRLDWCFRTPSGGTLGLQWPRIKRAFVDALGRYERKRSFSNSTRAKSRGQKRKAKHDVARPAKKTVSKT